MSRGGEKGICGTVSEFAKEERKKGREGGISMFSSWGKMARRMLWLIKDSIVYMYSYMSMSTISSNRFYDHAIFFGGSEF